MARRPPNHYAVLELPMTASEQDVRKAYRRLAVRWHPDKNLHDSTLAEIRFKEVLSLPAAPQLKFSCWGR